MTGNHNESDLAEVTSRQTSPVMLGIFALVKEIGRVRLMLSPSWFSWEVLQMYADGGAYMMRAFGRWERLGSSFLSHKCPAEAGGHEVSHEGAMTWPGVKGL